MHGGLLKHAPQIWLPTGSVVTTATVKAILTSVNKCQKHNSPTTHTNTHTNTQTHTLWILRLIKGRFLIWQRGVLFAFVADQLWYVTRYLQQANDQRFFEAFFGQQWNWIFDSLGDGLLETITWREVTPYDVEWC